MPDSLFMGLVRGRDWGVFREASSGWGCGFGRGEWRAKESRKSGAVLLETVLTPPLAPPSSKFPSRIRQRNQLRLLCPFFLSAAPPRG